LEMLSGAMDELQMGDPWSLVNDIGPVIDVAAQTRISDYIAVAQKQGRVIKQMQAPSHGTFVGPTVLRVNTIADMPQEIFGPVLHVATFKATEIDAVVAAVNATGYGLTFGLHTRIDDRVQSVTQALNMGNTYVNRNQIGAVVGSQPFGGEGLSGTGPKAGGPHYLGRFASVTPVAADTDAGPVLPHQGGQPLPEALAEQLAGMVPSRAPLHAVVLPGPTGESNRLTQVARAPLLCLGPSIATAQAQARAVQALGGQAVLAVGLPAGSLVNLEGFSGALWWGDAAAGRDYAHALALRSGPILALIGGMPDLAHVVLERHVCIDTTASGGNAQLLAEVSEA
jgi:RHH-type proline utilization regulon transcriptional repressor/proline dehydrogenase/delta 1-pyrroline-5-carboxylate dehydrogenase